MVPTIKPTPLGPEPQRRSASAPEERRGRSTLFLAIAGIVALGIVGLLCYLAFSLSVSARVTKLSREYDVLLDMENRNPEQKRRMAEIREEIIRLDPKAWEERIRAAVRFEKDHERAKRLVAEFTEITKKTTHTAADAHRLIEIRKELVRLKPSWQRAFDESGFGGFEKEVKALDSR
jgi:hypothetical protein